MLAGIKGTQQATENRGSLLELTGSLMGMIVLPYLGPAVAQKESSRGAPGACGSRRACQRRPIARS